MNKITKFSYRIFQGFLKIAYVFANIREPILIEGKESSREISKYIKKEKLKKILLVSGPHIYASGLPKIVTDSFDAEGIGYVVYTNIKPNPTIDNIEDALNFYKENKCDGVVAFGGGSPMDLAKAMLARYVRPKKPIQKLKGLLKVGRKIPTLFAIPTTAGTGSECTVASVVTDSKTHEKYAISDPVLVPKYAVLDPLNTVSLSPYTTATTGMDALTHSLEAYLGRSNNKRTLKNEYESVKLIFENLVEAYKDGTNLVARENMLKASYQAGIAITNAYVGYVHALAHALGGMYNISHGYANAVLLPYVLESYGSSIYKKLAVLSDLVGIKGESNKEKALNFIQAIKDMNKEMQIEDKLDCIKENDIEIMVKRALEEANPVYPVPVIFGKEELTDIYHKVMK